MYAVYHDISVCFVKQEGQKEFAVMHYQQIHAPDRHSSATLIGTPVIQSVNHVSAYRLS